ncbi:basic salivary proline-rich protein 1-like [Moschus berezovskii]|uniref:basic salivary proline-rich protein 1-like n=1 Tax=Moschus berezovskii TaxID=68408 RepID=UPI00244400E9|nr:basic salivary proline-rich protein 1-like [Moschus berezovskii]
MGRAGSPQGPQRPAGLSRNPGAGPGRCAEASQGGGEGRVPGSGKERGGGDQGRTSAASPRTAADSPGTARGDAHAHTLVHKDPRAHAPPCGSRRPHCPGCMHTVHLHTPRIPGTPDLQGRARRAKAPRDPHTCVHTLTSTHTQIAGPPRSARRPDTAHPPLAPTASPRLHADASERDGRRAGRTAAGLPEVGPLPAGLPLRAPAREPGLRPPPSRTPSPRPPSPPRTHCLPRCGCGCGPGSRAASRVPAGPRRRRQGRSGRALVLRPPSCHQKPPSSRF